MEERVILVDEEDREVGEGEKISTHRQRRLHRSFTIFIYNPNGELLLQRRAKTKYHSGGLWSNACCGHPRPGEEVSKAARRRLREEMGIDCELREVLQFTYHVALDKEIGEDEFDHVFMGLYEGKVQPNAEEADAYKWVEKATLVHDVQEYPELYTEWFKIALEKGVLDKDIQLGTPV